MSSKWWYCQQVSPGRGESALEMEREKLSKINWDARGHPQPQVSEEAPASSVRNQRWRSDTTDGTCCFYPPEPATSSGTGQPGHCRPLSCPHSHRCHCCTPRTDGSLERAWRQDLTPWFGFWRGLVPEEIIVEVLRTSWDTCQPA